MYLSFLSHLGTKVDYDNYRIQNIVATYDHCKPLSLYHIAERHCLEFEPEMFPAVRYRIPDIAVTVNIFHTGKCTILGAKSTEIVSQAIDRIKEIFRNAER